MSTPILDKLEEFYTAELAEGKAAETKRQDDIHERFKQILEAAAQPGRDFGLCLSVAMVRDLEEMYLDFSSRLSRIKANQNVQINFLRKIFELMELERAERIRPQAGDDSGAKVHPQAGDDSGAKVHPQAGDDSGAKVHPQAGDDSGAKVHPQAGDDSGAKVHPQAGDDSEAKVHPQAGDDSPATSGNN